MAETLDFTIPKFFVYIIESNKIPEVLKGFSEGGALTNVLRFSGVESEYRPGLMKSDLANSLHRLPELVNRFQAMPIVHISAHGSPDGFELTLQEFVTWRELDEMLQPLHSICGGSYLLCLSSCHGLAGIKLAFNNTLPLFGVVGTLKQVPWPDNVIGFATFYHLLRKGKTIREAISGMRSASGHNDYNFVHGPSFVNAYRKDVQQH
jgi:hypothetical protein